MEFSLALESSVAPTCHPQSCPRTEPYPAPGSAAPAAWNSLTHILLEAIPIPQGPCLALPLSLSPSLCSAQDGSQPSNPGPQHCPNAEGSPPFPFTTPPSSQSPPPNLHPSLGTLTPFCQQFSVLFPFFLGTPAPSLWEYTSCSPTVAKPWGLMGKEQMEVDWRQ